MASKRELSAIGKKQLAMREALWPGNEPNLWDRGRNKGFTTIPKTMPFVMKIMDEMTKGAPVSSTYLALWCSTWDNSYISLAKPADLAQAAGFGGQRDVHTWSGRMKKLQELGFIDIKPGKSGPLSHAIIWNPHTVIRFHHDVSKTLGLVEASFTGLLEAAMEVGAADMLEPLPADVTTLDELRAAVTAAAVAQAAAAKAAALVPGVMVISAGAAFGAPAAPSATPAPVSTAMAPPPVGAGVAGVTPPMPPPPRTPDIFNLLDQPAAAPPVGPVDPTA